MTDGLVCKTNVAAHHEHNDCTRGIFRRVCVGCGVCETFASDKNEISTGHFGGGHVRENRAKIADLRKKKLLIRTTLKYSYAMFRTLLNCMSGPSYNV